MVLKELLKKLKHKVTRLQDHLEDKEDEIERLDIELIIQAEEREELSEDLRELEETK